LTTELYHGYYYSEYILQWEEGLVRSAYEKWNHGMPGYNSSEGLLNFTIGYSGRQGNTPSSFTNYGGLDIAQYTVQAMLHPGRYGISAWTTGKAANRPSSVGSYSPREDYHLPYIKGFINDRDKNDTFCNVMTYGDCSETGDFVFALTGDEEDYWWNPINWDINNQ
jgi:hypothetical protein